MKLFDIASDFRAQVLYWIYDQTEEASKYSARRPVPTGVVCNALGDLFAVAMMIAAAVAADDGLAANTGNRTATKNIRNSLQFGHRTLYRIYGHELNNRFLSS